MSDKKVDIVNRGNYSSSPLGTTIFLGLRVLDGFVLQRALQVLNPMPALFAKLGLSIPPPPPSGGPPLATSDHDLTPFQAIIWGMSVGYVLKHFVWVLYTSKEAMLPGTATSISVVNAVMNSANTLAFSLASVNPTWSEGLFRAATPLYVVGVLVEMVSEVQRKWFKDDPKNEGKLYTGGLFGYARSINYLGYTIWRTSFATAGGGWAWGGLTAAFFTYDFTQRSIPILDEYCTKRYGVQWEEFKRKAPYAFFPGLY